MNLYFDTFRPEPAQMIHLAHGVGDGLTPIMTELFFGKIHKDDFVGVDIDFNARPKYFRGTTVVSIASALSRGRLRVPDRTSPAIRRRECRAYAVFDIVLIEAVAFKVKIKSVFHMRISDGFTARVSSNALRMAP